MVAWFRQRGSRRAARDAEARRRAEEKTPLPRARKEASRRDAGRSAAARRHGSGMTLVYVGLGSNLAHPRHQLARAMRALARLPRTRVVGVSSNYVSAPVDCPGPQPEFVNAVAALETKLPPLGLLARLHAIERRQRRTRHRQRNAP